MTLTLIRTTNHRVTTGNWCAEEECRRLRAAVRQRVDWLNSAGRTISIADLATRFGYQPETITRHIRATAQSVLPKAPDGV